MYRWKFFVLIILVVTGIIVLGQDDGKSVNFIEGMIRTLQPDGKIIYTDQIGSRSLYKINIKLANNTISGITKETKQNSITLTKQEKKFLKHEVEKFGRPYWPNNMFPNSEMIKETDLVSYIRKAYEDYSENYNNPNNTDTDKMTLVKNYQRPNVFEFTKPIYLRNNTVCLMFFASLCGNPCGFDELCFYKLDNGKWMKWVVVMENYY